MFMATVSIPQQSRPLGVTGLHSMGHGDNVTAATFDRKQQMGRRSCRRSAATRQRHERAAKCKLSKSAAGLEGPLRPLQMLSLIHISEPTRLLSISYAVFC